MAIVLGTEGDATWDSIASDFGPASSINGLLEPLVTLADVVDLGI
jgi:hypothetical protein